MSDILRWRDPTIALAGILQACTLVDKLARTGYLDKQVFETVINSLLEMNPSSTLATFGGLSKLTTGFETVEQCLEKLPDTESQQVIKYLFGVFHLQSKLMKKPDVLQIIHSRLQQIQTQAAHFEPTHDNVVANLADLYSDTLSTFRYRIHVQGNPTYLQQDRVAAQIRTLLFGAIRATILFRQVGGKRWHLVTQRKKFLAAAGALKSEALITSH
ncbi:high frequency lysogenization protein HflD [Aurantivibrio plasticivorans]